MSERRPLISGNWKMHHNHFEAIQAVQKLAYLVSKATTDVIDVSVHPPFTDLRSIQTLIDADDLPRRELFGETDEMVAAKVSAIQKHGMTPIACVGETLDEREAGDTEAKVIGQIDTTIAGRTKAQIASMVIAYEPIWAIGTGKTATSEDAQAVCASIRARIAHVTDPTTAGAVRIQYGGSVKPGNIAELMAQPDIDGALVGGASLDPDEFSKILNYSA